MTRESSRRLRKSRKAKVEALPTSEFNARMIVDGIPGLVELVSADGEMEVVNRQMLEYFGRSLEELRNWANSDVIYFDDIPLANETFNTLPAGRPFDIEVRLRRLFCAMPFGVRKSYAFPRGPNNSAAPPPLCRGATLVGGPAALKIMKARRKGGAIPHTERHSRKP